MILCIFFLLTSNFYMNTTLGSFYRLKTNILLSLQELDLFVVAIDNKQYIVDKIKSNHLQACSTPSCDLATAFLVSQISSPRHQYYLQFCQYTLLVNKKFLSPILPSCELWIPTVQCFILGSFISAICTCKKSIFKRGILLIHTLE